jgi:DNA-binding transcriptional MerR regulator
MENALPPIPPKRYFTIGEVSELCQVKPYVLRYWEQEFTQLKPMKRRGNRRYYQLHEVQLIRRIRGLLYDEGFTIAGARNRLTDPEHASASVPHYPEADIDWNADVIDDAHEPLPMAALSSRSDDSAVVEVPLHQLAMLQAGDLDTEWLRAELLSIRRLLDA